MVNRLRSAFLPMVCAVGSLFLPATIVKAWTISIPTGGSFVVVGTFTNPSTGFTFPGVCYSTASGYQALAFPYAPNGLIEASTIQLNAAENVVVFGGSYFAPSTCAGFNVSPMVTNGWSLTVRSGAGNDIMWGPLATTNIALVGEAGDDRLYLFASGIANGGDGNDKLFGYEGTSEWLIGGNGSDCIDDADRGAQIYDCGPGTDYYAASDATFYRTSCEYSTSSCN